ncbi:hypothetical protein N2152v2_005661 [Parachlorella kessleri]
MPGNKAVQVTKYVPDKPLDGLVITDTDIPTPGPGQVLVRVTLRTVNPVEFLQSVGFFDPRTLPYAIGFEGVGRVERLGPGYAGTLRPGQKVVGIPFGEGTFQQYLVADEKNLWAVPEEMSDEVAAQFFMNPFTALALVDMIDPPKGAWLVQTAAGSAVGRLVIQVAKHKGAKTINVVRREAQVEELKQLGADAVIVVDSDAPAGELAAKVQEVTGGEGAYGAADCIGGAFLDEVVKAVCPGGTTVVYGNLSGTEKVSVSMSQLFQTKVVKGCVLAVWLQQKGEERMKLFEEMAKLLMDGTVTLYTGKRFPLERAKEAMEESKKAAHGAKILLEG